MQPAPWSSVCPGAEAAAGGQGELASIASSSLERQTSVRDAASGAPCSVIPTTSTSVLGTLFVGNACRDSAPGLAAHSATASNVLELQERPPTSVAGSTDSARRARSEPPPPGTVEGSGLKPEMGLRSQRLLQHLSECTSLGLSEYTDLPVDFKMTLQLLEYMGKQGQLLSDMNAKVDSLRQDVSQHMDSIKFGLQSGRQELASRSDETNTNFRSGLDDLFHDLRDHFAEHLAETSQQPLPDPAGKYVIMNDDKSTDVADGGSDIQVIDEFVIQSQEVPSEVAAKARLSVGTNGMSDSSLGVPAGYDKGGLHHMMSFSTKAKSEHHWLRRILSSQAFDLVCAVVILTNAFTIGVSAETDVIWAMANPGVPHLSSSHTIMVLNRFYISFYVTELLFKLFVFRTDFFCGENARWNIFDFVLVFTGIYDIVSELTPLDFGSGVGVTWLRVLRICKTLKLLRVIRVMRFFQVLRTMVSSIAGSMNTLFWSILMIGIIMYMFGLCFLQAVTIYLNEHKKEDVEPMVLEGIVMYWSSVQQAMGTLFMSVTGGADWEPLAMPIKAADSFFYGLFFFYIAFAALAVLNVLTGMFVDTAMKVAQQDEENVENELMDHTEIENYRKCVTENMQDMEGYITWEFVDENTDMRTVHFMNLLEIQVEDTRRVFKMMDTEKKGFVDLEEFIKGCFHAKGSPSGLDMIFLMSETKNLSKTLATSVKYLEERFDEIYEKISHGGHSGVTNLQTRMNAEGSRMSQIGLLSHVTISCLPEVEAMGNR